MPGVQDKKEYSITTGAIFLFNLIVGTAALALPRAIQQAGWVVGIGLIMILAFFSLLTTTYVVESLAVSNALSKKRYGEINTLEQETQNLIQKTINNDCQESSIFEITEKYEMGEMGVIVSPKWVQVLIYFCLCCYLFGDLTIYSVAIGTTLEQILCTNGSSNNSDSNLLGDTECFKGNSLRRIDVYRLSIFTFILLEGPFIFFNVQKTKLLQFFTTGMRWVTFCIMISWSVHELIKGKQGNPPYVDSKKIPTLFGTLVYSFMCQHSLPGILQPITNKKYLSNIVILNFIVVAIFYITLSMTAIFAFSSVNVLYTINFWQLSNLPGTSIFVVFLSHYLALFPVFTLSTTFPIVGITLRNNLRSLILKNGPKPWFYDRLLFPLITIIPPAILALTVSNLHLLVGFVGTYAGACVQYLIPCLLVIFSRSHAKDFEEQNVYASPFKSKYWVYAVIFWMCVSLILITINLVFNKPT